jgi:hypothetical protein
MKLSENSGWNMLFQSVAGTSCPHACFFIIMLPLFLTVSCSTGSGNDPARPVPRSQQGARIMSDQEWLSEKTKDNGLVQDKSGNWVPKSNKRSQLENQGRSPYFQGEYAKKAYKPGEYKKQSFWGNKEYGRQAYGGNTDGSRFQTASRHDGQSAREAASAADIPDPYQTGTYGTNAARETGVTGLAKPGNAEIENRREVFEAPEIIDWRQQRNLTLEQSKGILGR